MVNFENSTKCWICDNGYVDGDVKVRDHCRMRSLENTETLHKELVVSRLD